MRWRTFLTAIALAVLLAIVSTGAPPVAAAPLGLTVAADGTLQRSGKAYRGIGVNYFDALYRHLKNPSDLSFDAGFKSLAAAKIPFARFMAGGYWPSEQRLYLTDRTEFFKRFDRVVKAAETHGIGLIPSLFWDTACVPDLVNEPRSAWGNTKSKTHTHMRTYVKDVVSRYRTSPAIWGWEFGNEYTLAASLPNASEWRPPIHPSLGTRSSRGPSDDLTYEMVRTAFTAFATEVRRYDKTRMITTGNAFPRAWAWHNWREGSWTEDSSAQFAEMLTGDNPSPVNVVSVHLYEGDASRLPSAVSVAAAAKKPLFVGEFGVSGPGRTTSAAFTSMLSSIESSGAALAAVWVYDYAAQPEWSLTRSNARSWQLSAVSQANARVAAG